MAKISNLNDFNKMTSNITSFSHAYLFDTNNLKESFIYAKEFAKKIVCQDIQNIETKNDIYYKIDNNEFDDLYIVNPETVGINTEEIEKLFQYMMTKSLRNNGKRVYIIYGFERLNRDISNKILKFLEEPVENLYAILLTENIDYILSTIISRCQIIKLSFEDNDIDNELLNKMSLFISKIVKIGTRTIAYTNDYFFDIFTDRIKMYESFQIIENILSNCINKKLNQEYNEKYLIDDISYFSLNSLINIMDITNKTKKLIKQNINLNLLIDRYIIEINKELDYVKNSRSNI